MGVCRVEGRRQGLAGCTCVRHTLLSVCLGHPPDPSRGSGTLTRTCPPIFYESIYYIYHARLYVLYISRTFIYTICITHVRSRASCGLHAGAMYHIQRPRPSYSPVTAATHTTQHTHTHTHTHRERERERERRERLSPESNPLSFTDASLALYSQHTMREIE